MYLLLVLGPTRLPVQVLYVKAQAYIPLYSKYLDKRQLTLN